MSRLARTTAAAAGLLVLAGAAPAHADPGGCQAFGGNVAMLGTSLGSLFGATASSVASSEAGAFPRLVVKPEQEDFCNR